MDPLNQPLLIQIEKGELIIRIGANTLAYALEQMVANNPYNEVTGGFQQKYKVVRPIDFANDVVHELCSQAEDGSNAVERMLDAVMEQALGDGSDAVEEIEYIPSFSGTKPLEKGGFDEQNVKDGETICRHGARPFECRLCT